MSSSNSKRKESISTRSEILNRKLLSRPGRDQLIEQGILHESSCANSLQQAEQRLKRARLHDQLNDRLTNRPGPLDLVQEKILRLDEERNESQVEKAIQDGQIEFESSRRKTKNNRRPLVFHEYTDSPCSSKPKVTKFDRLSCCRGDQHEIRLAQQKLLLELTSGRSTPNNLPSFESQVDDDQLKQIDLFSTNELEAILESFSPTWLDDERQKQISQLDNSSESRNDEDQLFIEMLLNDDRHELNDVEPTKTFESNRRPVPRITNIDEFDAFLRDFTMNFSSTSRQTINDDETNLIFN